VDRMNTMGVCAVALKEDIIQGPGFGLREFAAKLGCNKLLGRKQQILLSELLDQQQCCEGQPRSFLPLARQLLLVGLISIIPGYTQWILMVRASSSSLNSSAGGAYD